MNKNAIQKFAIWARNELIAQVSQRAYQYGIDESGFGDASADTLNGRLLTAEEKSQRQELIKQIKEKGYQQVMEEVAYTWFNRFIALLFMEVNNYLPSHIRVFSDASGAFKPEILNDVLHLDLPGLDSGKVAEYIESNDTEGLYRYLLLTQCNALNSALPVMFERMGGYTEMLLPNNILRQDSVLGHMVADIPEADWTDQVQIIGWLYQYYNTELKDDTFALLKKNVKITKERIPSATQLFTPDWIVRYMVENSLGRIYVDKRKNEGIYADGRGLDEMTWHEAESERIATEKLIADKMGWKYYLPEAEQTQEVRKQLDEIQSEYANLDVKGIKVIDPCMGSEHILVYAFDVLMQIYTSTGWDQREAAQSILENNLYGLDIDDRAAQLAYFAVMMKARQYDRRIFSRGIQPNIYSIRESNGIQAMTIEYFHKNDPKLKADIESIVTEMRDAKEYGSILNITPVDFAGLYARFDEIRKDINMMQMSALEELLPLVKCAEVLAQKYDVVVTNPPYRGIGDVDIKLSDFVKKYYPDSKADLFSVFMESCEQMLKKNGYRAMITQQTWMFSSSFKNLRMKMMKNEIVCMIHLGARAFDEIGGEVVQPTAFVCYKEFLNNYSGTYFKLDDYGSQDEKEIAYLHKQNCYIFKNSKFAELPGGIYSYWASEGVINAFKTSKSLENIATPKRGMCTCGNDLFYRNWYEVSYTEFCYPKVTHEHDGWVPLNKGGEFRKWYGNLVEVVDWKDDAKRLRSYPTAQIKNEDFYFFPAITWSSIASKRLSFRYTSDGFIFDQASNGVFPPIDLYYYFLALLNSKAAKNVLTVINPTFNVLVGDIAKIPVVIVQNNLKKINSFVIELINLSKSDWDLFETSWDFKRNPLVNGNRLAAAYTAWKQECEDRFQQLKKNEEELNRIFIDIYGLQDELTPDVADKDVTVHRVFDSKDDVPESMKGSNYVRTMRDEIVSLISYAVGCMFGRYSLDKPGLVFAGYSKIERTTKTLDGDDPELEKFAKQNADGSVSYGSYYHEVNQDNYKSFPIDTDNIIPICDDDYFDDDITGRFVKWVETVYGSETLEENLKFVADALGGKGTPREVIRSYFLNDFYADHLKTYQKRPIYWLFDSGKKNGFKALCYMHRYQRDLLARLRTDYVHEQQERYRTQLAQLGDAIDHASASERVKLTKQQKKFQDQATELQKYEEKVHHLADQNIEIDLDDGVKHNYELFADVLAKIK